MSAACEACGHPLYGETCDYCALAARVETLTAEVAEVRTQGDVWRESYYGMRERVETLESDNRFIRCELDVESIKHDQSVARLTARVETLTAERDEALARLASIGGFEGYSDKWDALEKFAREEAESNQRLHERVETLENALREERKKHHLANLELVIAMAESDPFYAEVFGPKLRRLAAMLPEARP
jgi:hypothetical protein